MAGHNAGFSYTEYNYCLQKGDGPLLLIRDSYLMEDLSEHLSDYPKLAERIRNKDFHSKDLEVIVQEYNRWTDLQEKINAQDPTDSF
ncbi:MAG: hypothetical protein V4714_05675 [Bacteroidota bacterium]